MIKKNNLSITPIPRSRGKAPISGYSRSLSAVCSGNSKGRESGWFFYREYGRVNSIDQNIPISYFRTCKRVDKKFVTHSSMKIRLLKTITKDRSIILRTGIMNAYNKSLSDVFFWIEVQVVISTIEAYNIKSI